MDVVEDEEEGGGELSEQPAPAAEEEGGNVSLSYLGLCKLLISQSNKTSSASFSLAYRVAALEALAQIAGSFSDSKKKAAWSELGDLALDDDEVLKPVLIAKRVEVVKSLLFSGIGEDSTSTLSQKFLRLSKHSAWTVRSSSCLLLSRLATLCSPLTRKFVTSLNTCVTSTLLDRKYAKCRTAALTILKSLLSRNVEGEKEYLLPFSESWNAAVKKCMKEEDIEVTGVASEVGVLLSRL